MEVLSFNKKSVGKVSDDLIKELENLMRDFLGDKYYGRELSVKDKKEIQELRKDSKKIGSLIANRIKAVLDECEEDEDGLEWEK